MTSRFLTARSLGWLFWPLRARRLWRAGKISLSRLVSRSRRPNTSQVPASSRSSRAASSSAVGGATWPAPPEPSSSSLPPLLPLLPLPPRVPSPDFLLLSDRLLVLAFALDLALVLV